MSDPLDRRRSWTPHPRLESVARVNEEGRILGAKSPVPLGAGSLLAQAVANTGLDDFGAERRPTRFLPLPRGGACSTSSSARTGRRSARWRGASR